MAELGITLTLTAAVVGSKKVRGSLLHLQPACMASRAVACFVFARELLEAVKKMGPRLCGPAPAETGAWDHAT